MSCSRPQAADVRRQRHPWHDTAPDHLAVRLNGLQMRMASAGCMGREMRC